jgi:hypothetical protein
LVLANVDAEHLLHISHGLLGSKAKVADQPLGKIHALKQDTHLRLKDVGVHNHMPA